MAQDTSELVEPSLTAAGLDDPDCDAAEEGREGAGSAERPAVRGLRSYNIVVDGKRTSVRLDPVSLESLYDIARRERMGVNELCTLIESRNRGNGFTFTAAIRIFLLSYYKAAATDEGHRSAGHGRQQPMTGTPFEEPDSLKASQTRRRNGRGRPPHDTRTVQ